jgi:integrase
MKVTLRQRKTRSGTVTLYLDLYGNGTRRLEYLNLYLTGDRHADKETMRLAEAIAAKRKLDSVSADHNIPAPSRLKEDFVEYCRNIGKEQRAHNTSLVWNNAVNHLIAYGGEAIPFARIDEDFIEGFKQYLLKDLKVNSASVYLAKIKSAIRQAVRGRILQRNPADGISIATEDTDRVYLTLPELRNLQQTECENQSVKDAFLFAAFSGLRYSDVKKLSWQEVSREGKRWLLGFRQQKTGNPEWLPLSAEAAKILQAQKGAEVSDRIVNPVAANAVFKLPAQQTIDKALKRWAQRAGIEKRISFHTARHTFATIGLKHGIDIYTMAKLLGHRSLESTQIYAKVVDESKRKAVDLMPRLSDGKRKPNAKKD